MDATQYSDYLRDRKVTLEKQITELQKKLNCKGEVKTCNQNKSFECVVLGKTQHALSLVTSELERIETDDNCCARCGVDLPKERQQKLPYTKYCTKCAN